MIELQKYLKEKSHDDLHNELGVTVKQDGDLFLYDYNQILSPKYHPVVRECRGIILDKNDEVIARPFDRFFNYGEEISEKDFDFSNCHVYEKVDGSLIKIFHYNNHWHVSTRGTIYADSRVGNNDITFKELVYKAVGVETQQEFDEIFKDCEKYTFICEVTSFENRVVVRHDGYSLWLLAVRDTKNGHYVDKQCFSDIVEKAKMKLPKEYSFLSIDDCLKTAKELTSNDEGYVVYKNGIPVMKIKSPAYVAMHHIRGNAVLTANRILDLILCNEQDEYLTYFPEDKKYFDPYTKAVDKLFFEMYNVFNKFKDVETIKEFAIAVSEYVFKSVLIDCYKHGKTIEESFDSKLESNRKNMILTYVEKV